MDRNFILNSCREILLHNKHLLNLIYRTQYCNFCGSQQVILWDNMKSCFMSEKMCKTIISAGIFCSSCQSVHYPGINIQKDNFLVSDLKNATKIGDIDDLILPLARAAKEERLGIIGTTYKAHKKEKYIVPYQEPKKEYLFNATVM